MRKQGGSTLIVVFLVFLIASILGLAIMIASMANYKMGSLDSKNQGAYYIAEGGINHMINKLNYIVQGTSHDYKTSKEFFQSIEGEFPYILEEFEKNKGDQPRAIITIELIEDEDDSRDYRLKSIGKIGKNTRTVSSEISISWSGSQQGMDLWDVFIFSGGSSTLAPTIEGKGGTIVINGLEGFVHDGGIINVSNIFIKGPASIKGNSFGNKNETGRIFIDGDAEFGNYGNTYGEVYINGDLKPGQMTFHNDVYIKGNVIYGSNIEENFQKVYYTGEASGGYDGQLDSLKAEDKLVQISTSQFNNLSNLPEIPAIEIELKYENDYKWYRDNGYYIEDNLGDEEFDSIIKREYSEMIRILADNCQLEILDKCPTKKLVVISKGDITIGGNYNNFTGALIAPYGRVTLGQEKFRGIIISGTGFEATGGGGTMTMLQLLDFFEEDEIPIRAYNSNGNNNNNGFDDGNNTGGGSKLTIKSPIREK